MPDEAEMISLLKEFLMEFGPKLEVLHGACPNSADEVAENACRELGVPCVAFPGDSGTYLKRNIEMAEIADACLAYWDGWSYGTAHTIAQMAARNKPVKVIGV